MARKDPPQAIPSSSSPDFFWAAIVFFTALFLYTWTLAPTVTLVDSGELIVVAHSLGIAHPPGFPLWVMLAHLVSIIPFGNAASRLNFSSAVFAALASATLSLIVAELSAAASEISARRGRNHTANNGLLILIPMLTAGLLMAFSRTLWSYATVTEVYALNTLLLLIIFFLMLRWRHRVVATKISSPTSAKTSRTPAATYDSFLYAAAFLFGLALGVHHVTVALTLPALGLIVYRTEGLPFFKSRRFLYAALVSAVAFVAVYTYLPLAASRDPVINWGEPFSGKAIWRHITGWQYQAFFSFAPSIIAEQFTAFARIVSREFGFAWLPLGTALALAGLASAFKQERSIFWFLVLIAGSNLAYTLTYDIAEDKDAYFLPLVAAFAIAAGLGARALIQFLLSRSLRPGNVVLVATAGLVLTVSVSLVANWPFNNRRNYFIAHDYVDNILDSIEPNGLLLTLDWQVASPLFYAQEVEQRRRDVKIVDINLLRRSWYIDYLKRTWPGLIERSQKEVDAFVAEVTQWERDPDAYRNNRRSLPIASAFQELIQSYVSQEGRIAPVYLTRDLLLSEGPDKELIAWLKANHDLVPKGLVFELASLGGGFREPGEVRWQTRGLSDGTLKFEKDDVVTAKVLPAYTIMLVNRGRYLAVFGQHQRAIDAFKQALALDPHHELARQGLEEITRNLSAP